MTEFVSYQDWIEKYCTQLEQAGVALVDAQIAAQLGWTILQTHQACYGSDSTTRVHFSDEALHPRLRAVAACCGAQSRRSEECYFVFAGNLSHLLHEYAASLSDELAMQTILEGIAVHEVRHRVQDRETASFVSFRRVQLSGFWPDHLTAVVCAGMHEEFNELVRRDALRGIPSEDLDWKYSDAEFDASVVERLYLHRWKSIENDEQLAKFVRMSCPLIQA